MFTLQYVVAFRAHEYYVTLDDSKKNENYN